MKDKKEEKYLITIVISFIAILIFAITTITIATAYIVLPIIGLLISTVVIMNAAMNLDMHRFKKRQ